MALVDNITTKTLRDFGQDRIANKDGVFAQDSVQEIGLSGSIAVEIVNPDLGIIQDHDGVSDAERIGQ